MKKTLLLFIVPVLLLTACSPQILNEPPLKYSLMAEYMELDSLGPIVPPLSDVADSTLNDYKSIPVYGGTLIDDEGDTLRTLPMGILLSEHDAVEVKYNRDLIPNLQVQLNASEHLRRSSYESYKEAELLYQEDIVYQKKLAERTFIEENGMFIGAAATLLSAVVAMFLVNEITN
jgi:hypothetical protein